MTAHSTTEYVTTIETPIGELLLTSNGTALTGLFLHGPKPAAARNGDCGRSDKVLAAAREELTAYCDGTLQTFNVPLAPQGTPFQQRVWQALLDIPFGETESYGQLARRIGAPNAARAVGMANGKNPIAIIIPCHRVIGTSGALVGYGGGLPRKRWLLDHEARCCATERGGSVMTAAGATLVGSGRLF
jgi:methylated-DNA-[protein]-cysteine S-methyltransferase